MKVKSLQPKHNRSLILSHNKFGLFLFPLFFAAFSSPANSGLFVPLDFECCSIDSCLLTVMLFLMCIANHRLSDQAHTNILCSLTASAREVSTQLCTNGLRDDQYKEETIIYHRSWHHFCLSEPSVQMYFYFMPIVSFLLMFIFFLQLFWLAFLIGYS